MNTIQTKFGSAKNTVSPLRTVHFGVFVLIGRLNNGPVRGGELEYHWSGSSYVDYSYGGLGGASTIPALLSGDLAGTISDLQVNANGGASISGASTITGDGYKLGINGMVAANGGVQVGNVLHVSFAQLNMESSWQDKLQLIGSGEVPFNSLDFNWMIEGGFDSTVTPDGYVNARAYFQGPGDDDFFVVADYSRDFQETIGPTQVSGLFTYSTLLDSNAKGAFSGQLGVTGYAVGGGQLHMGFGNTASLESITFPDGSTPESHGFTIVLDSGLPSPNLIVPEPSSAILLALAGACVLITRGWRIDIRRVAIALLLLGFAGFTSKASAAVVVGPSVLLGAGDADQLQSWLDEGPITLTNIFEHTVGDGKTSADFHAAADGQGRTFSVIQVLSGAGSVVGQIIGGYNPQSWDSASGWHVTASDADRTAFTFNLTSDVMQSQKLNSDPVNFGGYQTFNAANFGPTFGAGYDLWVEESLGYGLAYNLSYGVGNAADPLIIGQPTGSASTLYYGGIEVFAISPGSVVPEPASLVLWSLLGLTLGIGSRWRRKRLA